MSSISCDDSIAYLSCVCIYYYSCIAYNYLLYVDFWLARWKTRNDLPVYCLHISHTSSLVTIRVWIAYLTTCQVPEEMGIAENGDKN